MQVLVIDNYDSFTYNLVEMLRAAAVDFHVCYNDQIEPKKALEADKILISPGPGLPNESGNLLEFMDQFKARIPMLGICLGHQALGELFGAKLQNLTKPCHGKSVSIEITKKDPLFENLPKHIQGGLYHSWTLESASLPAELESIATYSNIPMAIRHIQYNLRGLQFHPESYATPCGLALLNNWLQLC